MPPEGRKFKKGPDARRGMGGARPGAGAKPKEFLALRSELRNDWPKAIKRIRELMSSKDDRVAYDACKWMAEQIIGKAEQRIAHTDGEGNRIAAVLAVVGVTEDDLAGQNDPADKKR